VFGDAFDLDGPIPDSGVGLFLRDIIEDFQGAGVAGGDLIVLGAINGTALEFDADNKFDSAGDVIRASDGKGGAVVQVHTDDDGAIDMEIALTGIAPGTLIQQDFDLGGDWS
jgi:hypothetical protein